jgi:hypothetical protein
MKPGTSVKHQLKQIHETSRVFSKRTERSSGANPEAATLRVGKAETRPVDQNELHLKATPEIIVVEVRKSNNRAGHAALVLRKYS